MGVKEWRTEIGNQQKLWRSRQKTEKLRRDKVVKTWMEIWMRQAIFSRGKFACRNQWRFSYEAASSAGHSRDLQPTWIFVTIISADKETISKSVGKWCNMGLSLNRRNNKGMESVDRRTNRLEKILDSQRPQSHERIHCQGFKNTYIFWCKPLGIRTCCLV